MSFSLLLTLDVAAAVALAVSAGWLAAAAVRRWRGEPHNLHLPLAVAAVSAAAAARAAAFAAFASRGPAYAPGRAIAPVLFVAAALLLAAAGRTRRMIRTRRASDGSSSRLLSTAELLGYLAAAGGAGVALIDVHVAPSAATAAALLVLAMLAPVAVWGLWLRAHPIAGGVRPAVRAARMAAIALPLTALVAPVLMAWDSSRLPGDYDLADHAQPEYGGGASSAAAHGGAEGRRSVTELTGPANGTPDVAVTLTAGRLRATDALGRRVDGLAFNGQIPGPPVRAAQGDLVEVRLRNRDVSAGVSLHWHGYNVPNAEDGVAGVTQDAVTPGAEHVYRFRAEQLGTYWYHSHQAASTQVQKGLFGALIVDRGSSDADELVDLVVLDHSWRAPGGFLQGSQWQAQPRLERRQVTPGAPVRLRIVNTGDSVGDYSLLGTPFRVDAIDGSPVNEPTEVQDRRLRLAAGGRYDITFTMPESPVTLVGLGQGVRVVLGAGRAAEMRPQSELDLATYGTSDRSTLDATADFDRDFTMDITRRLTFLDGRTGYNWAVNGRVYPSMPMYMVDEGDRVRLRITNRTTAHHPIHLHGHHLLVLSRNGTPVTGAPWRTDTLNAAPGESYEVAFVADNPGIWPLHCHDLGHAADGFVMHLGYSDVKTPFRTGDTSGNQPE